MAIEAGSSLGWHKIIGLDGMFFGMDQFGLSASAEVLYNHFGLAPEKIVKSIITHPYFKWLLGGESPKFRLFPFGNSSLKLLNLYNFSAKAYFYK